MILITFMIQNLFEKGANLISKTALIEKGKFMTKTSTATKKLIPVLYQFQSLSKF